MYTSPIHRPRPPKKLHRTGIILGAALLTVIGGTAAATASSGGSFGPGAGTLTAHLVRESTLRNARGDYWLALGKCVNISDPAERAECVSEAGDDLVEAIGLAWDQYEARLDVVAMLGEAPYDPEIDPADFVSVIDNPYRPMIPGTTMIYEADTEDGLEEIVVTVTDDTKEILGVECTVVRDTVSLEGELVEDTLDYFAQDVDGNLWYFGEISLNYEDGELVDIEGSWEAGVDGAKPGIIAHAAPVVGTTFRQEFLLAEAEDVAQVLDLAATATVAYGTFADCMQTQDWTPIEPDVFEHKFYAPGVGVVLEVDLESGERVELVDIITE